MRPGGAGVAKRPARPTGRARLACALIALAAAGTGCARSTPPPNVVVVLIDTLRQDHLAVYGYERETAPALTALAADSAVLDGLSPSSWTKPAVASLFTGLHPLRHAAYAGPDLLPDGATTLAEILRASGYTTLAVSANGFVAPKFAMDQGFDEFRWMGDVAGDPAAPADAVNAEVIPRLEGLRSPFFLYVHYIDPHTPYGPPVEWNGSPLSPELREAGPVGNDDLDMKRRTSRPAKFLRRVRDLYDGEIRFVDGQLRALLDALAGRGLMRDTILVVTSDHGEELEDHGRMSHGQTLYEEVTRVPLLVHAPKRIVPGPRRGTVSLLDVLPTLLELAGLDVPEGLDGRSIAPFLGSSADGPLPSRRQLLHLDAGDGAALALVDGPRKLIVTRATEELFDLDQDPRERESRLAGGARAPAGLRGTIAAAHNRLSALALDRVTSTGRDDGGVEAIRALGYVAAGARQIPLEPRRIPSEIAIRDDVAGFADPDLLLDCLRPIERRADGNLLEGWFPSEEGKTGRWSAPEASLLLRRPERPATLRLTGMNHDPREASLAVRVDGSEVDRRRVPPGAFDIRLPLPSVATPRVLLELGRDPPFRPADLGMPDGRTLGLFWSEICLAPPADGPTVAAARGSAAVSPRGVP